jgi:hypothetical protein
MDPDLDLLLGRAAGPDELDDRQLDFLFDDAAAQRAGDRSIHAKSSLQIRARL